MSTLKQYSDIDVHTASIDRINYVFDNFERVYLSFSAGKDSSVMFHLIADEAKRRGRKVGVLFIDLEAQYNLTIKHAKDLFKEYSDVIDLYWVCLPMSLRNAVSNFEPRWICWEEDKKDVWVREMPEHEGVINDPSFFPFFQKGMEFEEFMVEFGLWYSQGQTTAAAVGIRCDESLNRFRTIASKSKEMFEDKKFTTKVKDELYNFYPIYDWKVSDIWQYHYQNPLKEYNKVYDYMYKAGLTPSQMRLCQPYGDDQRRGLWLYHILEPATWYKVVARINGVNSGALYVQENGNITGYNKIYKPEGHTWKSYCNLLLSTLPKETQEHYLERFKGFLKGWRGRGYDKGIPDEAPVVLENKHWAPSWRRLCKCLLRNDYWCKGLGLTQPRSEAYGKYLKLRSAGLVK